MAKKHDDMPDDVPFTPPAPVATQKVGGATFDLGKFAKNDTSEYHAKELSKTLSHFGWRAQLNPEADGQCTLYLTQVAA